MYLSVYYNLCHSKKQLKEFWVKGSGLHRHHIIPVHSGGTDEENNFTYLTVREHVIAHFLLWKIHRNPNDLRSMHMLGANLSPQYRKITGDFCRDNKIGIYSDEYKNNKFAQIRRCKNSAETQKRLKVGTFSEEGRKQLVTKAGRVSGKLQKENKMNIHDPANFQKYASLGGRAIKGMICITNGKHRTRIKPEKLQEYISNGYREGFILFS
jgi:hypothetical protein